MARYQKVLVLLDLSDDSEQVLIAGRDLAAYSKASIVALHVVEFVPVEPMGESLMPTMQIEEELVERSRDGSSSSSPGSSLEHAAAGSRSATPRRKFCGWPKKNTRI